MRALLRTVPLFAWLPEEAPDILNGCFDLEVERLTAGETRRTAGRVGCLLEGGAVFRPQDAAISLSPGNLFAISRDIQGLKHPEPGTLTAVTDCAVAWFDFTLTTSVCYRACWFHVRLLREIDALLAK